MATTIYKTPGVYVQELPAFAPSIIGVQTAVPAFIGYTEKAEINGKPVFDKAIPIGSLADYDAIFGGDFPAEYEISLADGTQIAAGTFDFEVFDPTGDKPEEKFFVLKPATDSEFNLYNSVRLFYANGGGNAYVVSVGNYHDGKKKNRWKDNLIGGLGVIQEQVGPTMLVIPDAVLLAPDTEGTPPPPLWHSADFKAVAGAMLDQCGLLQDRVAILDVYGTQYATKDNLPDIISQFRKDVDGRPLNYGMAYFPFLHTTVVGVSEIDYTNIVNVKADPTEPGLQNILAWEGQNLYGKAEDPNNPQRQRAAAVQADILAIATSPDVKKLNQNLSAALPLLPNIEAIIAAKNNTLPASGAMAGVYTAVDNDRGVWNAPANITLNAVLQPSFRIDSDQQGDLNVPVDGKAVDAIRDFVGRGSVVWGARTLDGNSNDYRYIQVRRTLIYIEQSIKTALNRFVFAANDGNTWSTVVATITSFLQSVWSRGGLMGATAAEAFTVQCGIGSTMTGQDILNGNMIVQVTLQIIRPAEFIQLNFKQKMEGVA